MKHFNIILFILLLPVVSMAQATISTVIGDGQRGFGADGVPSTNTQVSQIVQKMLIMPNGDMLFCDSMRVRKVDAATGVVSTIAGAYKGFGGDGGPATDAGFNTLAYMAFDHNGDLFLADAANHRIRKIDMQTGIVTTVVGDGNADSYGDNGPAILAAIHTPMGIAFDTNNVMLISEYHGHRIREVFQGYIKTLAGTGVAANNGDGGLAGLAAVNFNHNIVVDSANNVYINCSYSQVIRKIDPTTGIISTIAGTGASGYSGDGGPATNATMHNIGDLVIDKAGNMYLSDVDNHVIRRIDAATGIISTIAGTSVDGFNGDNLSPLNTQMNRPIYMTLDSCTNLYFFDQKNYRVRKIGYDNCDELAIGQIEKERRSVRIYPNPASTELTITADIPVKEVSVTDVTGRVVLQRTVNSEQVTVDVSGLSSGVYFVRWFDSAHHDSGVVKFVRE